MAAHMTQVDPQGKMLWPQHKIVLCQDFSSLLQTAKKDPNIVGPNDVMKNSRMLLIIVVKLQY